MCGIIGVFSQGKNSKNVNEAVRMQMEDQHERGMKGFGAVFIEQNRDYKIKRACEPSSIHVDLALNPSQMILLHHRTPTSSDNKISQTHPFLIDDGSLVSNYLVIHNGHITNHATLKKEHEDLGFVYKTALRWQKDTYHVTEWEEYNDSEAFAIELARYVENQTQEIACMGSWAFIALQINKQDNKVEKLLFGRSLNPLNMSLSWGNLMLSSTGPGEEIKKDTLYTVDLSNITHKDFKKFEVIKSPLKSKTLYLQPVVTKPPIVGASNWEHLNAKNRLQKSLGFKVGDEFNYADNEKDEEIIDEKKDQVADVIDNLIVDINTTNNYKDIDFKVALQEIGVILGELAKELMENAKKEELVLEKIPDDNWVGYHP